MNIVVATSIGSATAIYEILAIAGYLTFGNNVGSNIVRRPLSHHIGRVIPD